MRDTRTVTGHDDESEAERKGEERAAAAHDRLEHARERARAARQEAAGATDPESAEIHREEARFHDQAAALHNAAERLQRFHVEEAREGETGGPAPLADLADDEEEGAS
jgi:hypothetical protein